MATLNHPSFSQPEDLNSKIWRYQSFTKLVALLESQSLFFCRMDKLPDIHEGSVPIANLDNRQLLLNEMLESADSTQSEQIKEMLASVWARREASRCDMAVSCWHMNEHESALMWSHYGGQDGAFAIQTTYKTFADCLPESVIIGKINYLNYKADGVVIKEENGFNVVMHKRIEFQDDKEIRGVAWQLIHGGKIFKFTDQGVSIPVNVEQLIQKIYVSPFTPEWVIEVLSKIIKRMGLNITVEMSALISKPIY